MVQPVMVGMAWSREWEAAGHVACSVKKHGEMNAGWASAHFLLFMQFRRAGERQALRVQAYK